jgi:hypothetical protein
MAISTLAGIAMSMIATIAIEGNGVSLSSIARYARSGPLPCLNYLLTPRSFFLCDLIQ